MSSFYRRYIKRFLDIVCALSALVLFSWLYVIIAIFVRVNLGSPVIFCQKRPGKIDAKTGKEKIFKLYKFRSMTNACDGNGELLPSSERLTKFGRILRATSLDELPEAWNILKGDMSVVGPRPLLPSYLDYFNDFERQRHTVRPGLTGYAQVNGRNIASWKNRFAMDVHYVKNVSFWLDFKIIIKTVIKTVKHENIEFAAEHQPIMEYFETHDEGVETTI